MSGPHSVTERMFARVTDQGTAMAETALCAEHYADTAVRAFSDVVVNGAADADPHAGWVDCSGNDALECTACGATVGGLPTAFDLMSSWRTA